MDLGDEKIFAHDIASAHLRRDAIVILSSCCGADNRGGLGLSAAHISAGAKQVIASLWRIPDRLAAEKAVSELERLHAPRTTEKCSAFIHPFLRKPFVTITA